MSLISILILFIVVIKMINYGIRAYNRGLLILTNIKYDLPDLNKDKNFYLYIYINTMMICFGIISAFTNQYQLEYLIICKITYIIGFCYNIITLIIPYTGGWDKMLKDTNINKEELYNIYVTSIITNIFINVVIYILILYGINLLK